MRPGGPRGGWNAPRPTSTARAVVACAFVALASAGCGSELTEIVLLIDTDIASADGLRVDAVYPSGRTGTSSADLAAQPGPRTLVLLHQGGDLGPIALTVSALDGSTVLASVAREVTFETGHSIRLRVLVSGACGACAPRTCGNDAECRSAVVRSCEYEGRQCVDAGVPEDAGAGDSGPDACPLDAVCGVASRHLVGDVVRPVPCDALPGEPTASVVTGSVTGAVVPSEDGHRLALAGTYTARVYLSSDASCFAQSTFAVDPVVALPDGSGRTLGELRDLAARVGAGFVAASGGAYAVDRDGWHDLRAVGVATGDVAEPELQTVAVHEGTPVFASALDNDWITRVLAAAPFVTTAHVRIALPVGNRTSRSMSARLDGVGPVVLATQQSVLRLTSLSTTPVVVDRPPDYDVQEGGWAAVGSVETPTLGAIWASRGDELVNRRLTEVGGTLGGGDSVSLPDGLRTARAGAVDDRGATTPSLFLCADGRVARFDFDARDWTAEDTLPPESAAWSGPCLDLAIGEGGDLWVAGGAEGLIRLSRDGEELARFGPAQGMPAGVTAELVATAWDGTSRQIWVLDRGARSAYLVAADALP